MRNSHYTNVLNSCVLVEHIPLTVTCDYHSHWNSSIKYIDKTKNTISCKAIILLLY